MKQFQVRGGAQVHFGLLTLRHNFRKFPRGKRKGFCPAQLEGLDIPIDDWSEFIFLENEGSKIDPNITQRLEKQVIEGAAANLHPYLNFKLLPLSKKKNNI